MYSGGKTSTFSGRANFPYYIFQNEVKSSFTAHKIFSVIEACSGLRLPCTNVLSRMIQCQDQRNSFREADSLGAIFFRIAPSLHYTLLWIRRFSRFTDMEPLWTICLFELTVCANEHTLQRVTRIKDFYKMAAFSTIGSHSRLMVFLLVLFIEVAYRYWRLFLE